MTKSGILNTNRSTDKNVTKKNGVTFALDAETGTNPTPEEQAQRTNIRNYIKAAMKLIFILATMTLGALLYYLIHFHGNGVVYETMFLEDSGKNFYTIDNAPSLERPKRSTLLDNKLDGLDFENDGELIQRILRSAKSPEEFWDLYNRAKELKKEMEEIYKKIEKHKEKIENCKDHDSDEESDEDGETKKAIENMQHEENGKVREANFLAETTVGTIPARTKTTTPSVLKVTESIKKEDQLKDIGNRSGPENTAKINEEPTRSDIPEGSSPVSNEVSTSVTTEVPTRVTTLIPQSVINEVTLVVASEAPPLTTNEVPSPVTKEVPQSVTNTMLPPVPNEVPPESMNEVIPEITQDVPQNDQSGPTPESTTQFRQQTEPTNTQILPRENPDDSIPVKAENKSSSDDGKSVSFIPTTAQTMTLKLNFTETHLQPVKVKSKAKAEEVKLTGDNSQAARADSKFTEVTYKKNNFTSAPITPKEKVSNSSTEPIVGKGRSADNQNLFDTVLPPQFKEESTTTTTTTAPVVPKNNSRSTTSDSDKGRSADNPNIFDTASEPEFTEVTLPTLSTTDAIVGMSESEKHETVRKLIQDLEQSLKNTDEIDEEILKSTKMKMKELTEILGQKISTKNEAKSRQAENFENFEIHTEMTSKVEEVKSSQEGGGFDENITYELDEEDYKELEKVVKNITEEQLHKGKIEEVKKGEQPVLIPDNSTEGSVKVVLSTELPIQVTTPPPVVITQVTPESRAVDDFQNFQQFNYMDQNMNYNQYVLREPKYNSSFQTRVSEKKDHQLRADSAEARLVYPIHLQATGSSKPFDNPFQMGTMETSKASQQLTVNGLMPMCFYGVPNQYTNTMAYRMPAYENPYTPRYTAYSAFGYPQMYANNPGQQAMYNYYNSMVSQQKYTPVQPFINQQANPYFCTYMPSSSYQFPPVVSATEMRSAGDIFDSNEFDLDDDDDIDFDSARINFNGRSIACPEGEKSCLDGSKCIKISKWCDGNVNCQDASDEAICSCRQRVDKNRLCDGYFDCPDGDDELECFGCAADEFSCDDWTERRKKGTCVKMTQRCDGIEQCSTGKDEIGCSILTSKISQKQKFTVSRAAGFLYRNYRGHWYPVCSHKNSWVVDVCVQEVGPHAALPIVQTKRIVGKDHGKFLTSLPHNKVEFLNACMGDVAIHVICPPIPCGTRIELTNKFRRNEVDTNYEDEFLPTLSRRRRTIDEGLGEIKKLLKNNDFGRDEFNGNGTSDDTFGNDMEARQSKIPSRKEFTFVSRRKNDCKVKRESSENEGGNGKDGSKGGNNGTDSGKTGKGKEIVGDVRVVGGKPSQPTSWPWVVAIYRNGAFHCGGVLMSESWIITAAHCIDMYWQHHYEVQAGVLRRFSYSPMEQTRMVSHVIGHQAYNRADMKNDLALMKVIKPFHFNKYIRPVCLPSVTSAGPGWLWGPRPGTICTAVGWGATVEHGPDPDHMREVEVPVLARCKHREDQEGQEICAGYLEGGRDACQGDSGGPLLCRNPIAPTQWYLAGIVSHGEGCARPDEPGAYTRVSLYLNWIAKSILDENLPTRQPLQKCPGVQCKGSSRCVSKKRRCDRLIDCLEADDEMACPTDNSFPSLIKHAIDNILLSTHNITSSEIDSIVEHETSKKSTRRVEREITVSEHEHNLNDFTNDVVDDSNLNTTTQSILDDLDISTTVDVQPKDTTTNIDPNDLSNTDINTENDMNVKPTQLNINVTTQEMKNNFEIVTEQIQNDGTSTTTKLFGELYSNTEGTTIAINTTTETTTTTTESTVEINPDIFLCKRIYQPISIHRKCDRITDCEDGSDEENCTCREFLSQTHPETICDGILDCKDETDELNCLECSPGDFVCPETKICIPKSHRCDFKIDCPVGGEDEKDCFALTDSSTIRLDKFSNPLLRAEGIISTYFKGKWIPLCKPNWEESPASTAAEICDYLGFSSYVFYAPVEVRRKYLMKIGAIKKFRSAGVEDVKRKNLTNILSHLIQPSNETVCSALYVKCSNSYYDDKDIEKIHHKHEMGENTPQDVILSPWNVNIYSDGIYKCSGILIGLEWVITSTKCVQDIQLHDQYSVAALGVGRGHLNIEGPHEQIRLISEITPVIGSDITLLRLLQQVNFTRYVRPLYTRNLKGFSRENERCVALGRDAENTTQPIFLKPVLSDCAVGSRCFERVIPQIKKCEEADSNRIPWSGGIVCHSSDGWYPAAIYHEPNGICGFTNKQNYTSISSVRHLIEQTMNETPVHIHPPYCAGIRCSLGECVEERRICDGIRDCKDGSDESEEQCHHKKNNCNHTECGCLKGEIKCKNGKCVPKSAFCDRNDDCGDHSDEPPVCSCYSYLELAAPEYLCDGRMNCIDKSDENPFFCKCEPGRFKCQNSEMCISNEFVCDGSPDCPDNDDETECYTFKNGTQDKDGAGVLMEKTRGIWHSYCLQNDTPTESELEKLCSHMNIESKNPVMRILGNGEEDQQVIVNDDWNFIKLNRYIRFYMRKSSRPLDMLQNDPNCKMIYLDCNQF